MLRPSVSQPLRRVVPPPDSRSLRSDVPPPPPHRIEGVRESTPTIPLPESPSVDSCGRLRCEGGSASAGIPPAASDSCGGALGRGATSSECVVPSPRRVTTAWLGAGERTVGLDTTGALSRGVSEKDAGLRPVLAAWCGDIGAALRRRDGSSAAELGLPVATARSGGTPAPREVIIEAAETDGGVSPPPATPAAGAWWCRYNVKGCGGGSDCAPAEALEDTCSASAPHE